MQTRGELMSKAWGWLWGVGIVLGTGLPSAEALEGDGKSGANGPRVQALLRDAGMTQGMALLSPAGGGAEAGRLTVRGAAAPVWQLAQWNSRSAFTDRMEFPTASWSLSNQVRWVTVAADGALMLGVDSRGEYATRIRRSASEPWVHSLAQQAIVGSPSLVEMRRVWLRFEARLREAETFRPEGYSAGLHAAQYQVVLTLNNTRAGAPGYGDFLWFVVPVYDDRYEVPPEYVAQDFAMTQGKLIYNPGAAALGIAKVRKGDWLKVEVDLRPWFKRALETAWEKGYLRDSRVAGDYRLAHINLGWEVPGLNRVAMELRGLALVAELE